MKALIIALALLFSIAPAFAGHGDGGGHGGHESGGERGGHDKGPEGGKR